MSHGQIQILRQIDIKSQKFLICFARILFFRPMGRKKSIIASFFGPRAEKKKSFDNFIEGFIFSLQTTDMDSISSYHFIVPTVFFYFENPIAFLHPQTQRNSTYSFYAVKMKIHYGLHSAWPLGLTFV